jgi:hypothetical protein
MTNTFLWDPQKSSGAIGSRRISGHMPVLANGEPWPQVSPELRQLRADSGLYGLDIGIVDGAPQRHIFSKISNTKSQGDKTGVSKKLEGGAGAQM